jgi:hypothetical protein
MAVFTTVSILLWQAGPLYEAKLHAEHLDIVGHCPSASHGKTLLDIFSVQKKNLLHRHLRTSALGASMPAETEHTSEAPDPARQ